MYGFGARAVRRNGKIAVSSYLDVDTRKYQYYMLNPTPLDCIVGYIMEDAVDDRFLKKMPHRRLNFIYGSISSYCSIINSSEWLDMIKQENELLSILGDIESDHLGEK